MNDKNITIRVCNPGKRYNIGESPKKYLTIRDAIVNFREGTVQTIPICSFVRKVPGA